MALSTEEARRPKKGRVARSRAGLLRKGATRRVGVFVRPSPADFRIVRHPILMLLVVGLLAGFCGVVVNPRAFLVASAAGAILALGLVLPAFSLLGLRGQVRYPKRRGEVGKELSVCLELRRKWPWPTYGLLVQGGWTSRRRWRSHDQAVWSVPALRAWRIAESLATFVPARRGMFPRTPARVTTSFPFGVCWARRKIESRGHVIVWPAIVPLAGGVSCAASDGWTDAIDTRRSGTLGPWSGTRPYQPGEPLRKIHWRQTARHDRLIVCERSAPVGRGAQIVLETDPAAYPGREGERMREKAISAAASLAVAMLRMGVRISALFDHQKVYEASGPDELTPFLDALACLEADRGAPLASLLHRPECRGGEGLAQLVVTTRWGLARLAPGALQARGGRCLVVDAPAARRSGWRKRVVPECPAGALLLPVEDPNDAEFRRLWKELCREI